MNPYASIDFHPDGSARCLYHELIDLRKLGRLHITRASRIEFNVARQQWDVFPPVGDKPLFSSPSRSECLRWERRHLRP